MKAIHTIIPPFQYSQLPMGRHAESEVKTRQQQCDAQTLATEYATVSNLRDSGRSIDFPSCLAISVVTCRSTAHTILTVAQADTSKI